MSNITDVVLQSEIDRIIQDRIEARFELAAQLGEQDRMLLDVERMTFLHSTFEGVYDAMAMGDTKAYRVINSRGEYSLLHGNKPGLGLESLDVGIAMEALGESLKAISKAIIDAIVSLVNKVLSFFGLGSSGAAKSEVGKTEVKRARLLIESDEKLKELKADPEKLKKAKAAKADEHDPASKLKIKAAIRVDNFKLAAECTNKKGLHLASAIVSNTLKDINRAISSFNTAGFTFTEDEMKERLKVPTLELIKIFSPFLQQHGPTSPFTWDLHRSPEKISMEEFQGMTFDQKMSLKEGPTGIVYSEYVSSKIQEVGNWTSAIDNIKRKVAALKVETPEQKEALATIQKLLLFIASIPKFLTQMIRDIDRTNPKLVFTL